MQRRREASFSEELALKFLRMPQSRRRRRITTRHLKKEMPALGSSKTKEIERLSTRLER
jgi:hypothetical protein